MHEKKCGGSSLRCIINTALWNIKAYSEPVQSSSDLHGPQAIAESKKEGMSIGEHDRRKIAGVNLADWTWQNSYFEGT